MVYHPKEVKKSISAKISEYVKSSTTEVVSGIKYHLIFYNNWCYVFFFTQVQLECNTGICGAPP